MGLFSGKKKTIVETSITRVIEDDKVVDTIKEAIIEAVLDSRDIPLNITDRMLKGPVQRFNKMHRYAKKEYTHGLPKSNSLSDLGADIEAKAVFDTIIGVSNYTIDYAKMASLNMSHMTRDRLIRDYQYDEATNIIGKLSAEKGETVYLENITPIVSDQLVQVSGHDANANWSIPNSAGQTEERNFNTNRPHSPITSVGTGEEGAVFHICWWTDEEESTITTGADGNEIVETTTYRERHDESIKLDMTGYFPFDLYYQVRYLIDGQGGHRYFTYRLGSGGYPELDDVLTGSEDPLGEYFPFVVFIAESQDQTRPAMQGTESYKTSEEMLDIMGMDYQEIGKKIQENDEGIDDVEQAFMMMAVPANTQDQAEIEYIFRYFEQLIENKGGSESGPGTMFFKDKTFSLSLSFGNLKKTYKRGQRCAVGDYDRTTETIHWTETSSYYIPKQDVFIGTIPKTRLVGGDWVFSNKDEFELVTRTVDKSKNYFTYAYQVDADNYILIETDDLVLRYNIAGQRGSSTSFLNMNHGVNADVNDDRLLIPINKGIANEMQYRTRERVYQRSMHFVFNSKIIVKIKWYQTGIFKFALTVLAIVITIYSAGTAFATLAAAAAIGATAFAFALIQMIVVSLAMQYGFSLVVKELGIEAAFILAIVTAMYGGYKAFKHGSVEGAPWASELLQVSSGLSSAVSKSVQEGTDGLRDAAEELQKEMKEAYGGLDDANDLLEANNMINPMIFVVGETPDQFYQRTIHSGNIGTSAFDLLHNHVDMNLRLPTINDTLGGQFNGQQ